jgi:hypothetical protein
MAGTQRDTLNHLTIKGAKHYFLSTVYLNYYSTPTNSILPDKANPNLLDSRLTNYNFSQMNIGYYVPLLTKDFKSKDSVRISNFSLLTTGDIIVSTPHFNGIPDHNLYKISFGFRGIYNNGKNDIFFADFTPLLFNDTRSLVDPSFKVASTLLWDHLVGANFSFRLGITRTFIFGNRYFLPYIGLRLGRLDKVNLSIQFPRNIALNFPVGRHFKGSVFMKPMGGMYSFANTDSLYSGSDQTLQFGQWSLLSGLRIDYNPSNYCSFFLSSGITQFNHISFASTSFNTSNISVLTEFYTSHIKPGSFLNAGITVRFGQAKQSYRNRNLYEMFDINNTIDPGDNNDGAGNGNIHAPGNKKDYKNIRYKDIEDLMDSQELY